MPASQKARSFSAIFDFISSSTLLSQPARAAAERFLQTSHSEDESAAEERARLRVTFSVWMGQLASTTNPARIIAAARVSHAKGSLCANTTTIRPLSRRALLHC